MMSAVDLNPESSVLPRALIPIRRRLHDRRQNGTYPVVYCNSMLGYIHTTTSLSLSSSCRCTCTHRRARGCEEGGGCPQTNALLLPSQYYGITKGLEPSRLAPGHHHHLLHQPGSPRWLFVSSRPDAIVGGPDRRHVTTKQGKQATLFFALSCQPCCRRISHQPSVCL